MKHPFCVYRGQWFVSSIFLKAGVFVFSLLIFNEGEICGNLNISMRGVFSNSCVVVCSYRDPLALTADIRSSHRSVLQKKLVLKISQYPQENT